MGTQDFLMKKAKMKLLTPHQTISFLLMEVSPLSLVDRSCWEDLAALKNVGSNIAKLAPTMGAEFAEWLAIKSLEFEDGWYLEDVQQFMENI